jgi:hypothetical protein
MHFPEILTLSHCSFVAVDFGLSNFGLSKFGLSNAGKSDFCGGPQHSALCLEYLN